MMLVKISFDDSPSDDAWASMSVEEQVEFIRNSKASFRQFFEALSSNSDDLRSAAESKAEEISQLAEEALTLLRTSGRVKQSDDDVLNDALSQSTCDAFPDGTPVSDLSNLRLSLGEEIFLLTHRTRKLIEDFNALEKREQLLREALAKKRQRAKTPSPGRPAKITAKRVSRTIRRLRKRESSPSQKSVARALRVTDRGLRKWRESKGFASWREVLNNLT